MQDARGNGNGHQAPVPSQGGTGALPAPPTNGNGKPKIPEALEKNKYQKGVSGNPKGRPKGSVSAPGAIHAILTAPCPRNKKLTNLAEWQEIAKSRARQGDWRGAEILFNKWAPDLRIPDVEAGAGGGNVNLTLNAFEQAIKETAPGGDRPSFEDEG